MFMEDNVEKLIKIFFFGKFEVDEIDWTPLNEQPAIPIEEVTANYLMGNVPFLTFYTPSGNNYHIFTNQTDASIGKFINRYHKLSRKHRSRMELQIAFKILKCFFSYRERGKEFAAVVHNLFSDERQED